MAEDAVRTARWSAENALSAADEAEAEKVQEIIEEELHASTKPLSDEDILKMGHGFTVAQRFAPDAHKQAVEMAKKLAGAEKGSLKVKGATIKAVKQAAKVHAVVAGQVAKAAAQAAHKAAHKALKSVQK